MKNSSPEPKKMTQLKMADVEALVEFMKKNGILRFEQGDIRVELSESVLLAQLQQKSNAAEPEKKDDEASREEAMSDLEDRLLIEDPTAYEELKKASS